MLTGGPSELKRLSAMLARDSQEDGPGNIPHVDRLELGVAAAKHRHEGKEAR